VTEKSNSVHLLRHPGRMGKDPAALSSSIHTVAPTTCPKPVYLRLASGLVTSGRGQPTMTISGTGVFEAADPHGPRFRRGQGRIRSAIHPGTNPLFFRKRVWIGHLQNLLGDSALRFVCLLSSGSRAF